MTCMTRKTVIAPSTRLFLAVHQKRNTMSPSFDIVAGSAASSVDATNTKLQGLAQTSRGGTTLRGGHSLMVFGRNRTE
jgi:hypothetical protein